MWRGTDFSECGLQDIGDSQGSWLRQRGGEGHLPVADGRGGGAGLLNPKPQTLNPKPQTLNPY